MDTIVNKLILVVCGAGVAMVASACDRTGRDRPASTITYSARQPRPDTTATSTRTIDSTGFVDTSGLTSEQRVRTEASGMRATEAGSERPTGTPGSGTPIPIEPRPPQRIGEPPSALGGEERGAGAPGDTIIGRLAQAMCDRETACNRVGPKRPFGTVEQCTSMVRERAREEVASAECARGFDNTSVGVCLTAIRQASCNTRLASIEELPSCVRTQLCAP
jgi:hypothetical protein